MAQQDGSDEQDSGPGPQLTDEQERAAGAESYVGEPISDRELSEVWTDQAESDQAGSDQAGSDPDSVSDPAKDDTVGSDWSDEGGATPTGPATDTDAGRTEPTD